jgi:hypothetical protein
MSSPPMAPQKANNAVWLILGILLGAVALVVVAGLTATGLILRHIDVVNSNNRVDIQTPVGEINVSKDQGHATGLPVYPGATKARDDIVGGSADISVGSEGVGIAAEAYESADSLDAVKAWYRSRLGPSFRLEGGKEDLVTVNRAHFNLGDQDWAFVDDRGDSTSLVAVKKRNNGAQITLLRVGKRDAQ